MKTPIKLTIPITEKTIDYILEYLMAGTLVSLMGIMIIACGAMVGFMIGLLIELGISLFSGIPPNLATPLSEHPSITISVIVCILLSILYGLMVLGVVEIRYKKDNLGGTKK